MTDKIEWKETDYDWENCMYRQQYKSISRLFAKFHVMPLSNEFKQRMMDSANKRSKQIRENVCDKNQCQKCFEDFVDNNGTTPEMTEEQKERLRESVRGRNIHDEEESMNRAMEQTKKAKEMWEQAQKSYERTFKHKFGRPLDGD